MEYTHPQLKLNTGRRWPGYARNLNIVGLDVNAEYCCAARINVSYSFQPNIEVKVFYDLDTEEEYLRIPTVMALDSEDPGYCYIGIEALNYAKEADCTLYRDFLRVPDERADETFGNLFSAPTYRRLMTLFFQKLLEEFGDDLFFINLPDDPQWQQGRVYYEELLTEALQAKKRFFENPDDHSLIFLLDQRTALEAFRMGGLEIPVDADNHRVSWGLAYCGYLMQWKEILLQESTEKLEKAFPWSWARFRDTLHDKIRSIIYHKLDHTLSYWADSKGQNVSFRKLIGSLTLTSAGISSMQEDYIPDFLRAATDTIINCLPTVGSDPQDDVNAFSGFPPTYLGPKAQWPNQLHYSIRSRVRFDLADQLPWLNGDAVDDLYYAQFTDTQGFFRVMKPFLASLSSYLPSEQVMLGPLQSRKLGFLGQLDSQTLTRETRKSIYDAAVQRKFAIYKDIEYRLLQDEKSWDQVAAFFYQAIYDRQVSILEACLPFPKSPQEESIEEGVLM